MGFRVPHEDLFTRSIAALFLKASPELSMMAARAMMDAAEKRKPGCSSIRALDLGDGPLLRAYPSGKFGPDLCLARTDTNELAAVIEVKGHADWNATAYETCEGDGREERHAPGKRAAEIRQHYKDNEDWYWTSGRKHRPSKRGVVQTDAYLGWVWWMDLEDEDGRHVEPGATTKHIILSLSGESIDIPYVREEGSSPVNLAFSSKDWIPVKIHDFAKLLYDLSRNGEREWSERDTLLIHSAVHRAYEFDSNTEALDSYQWLREAE
ncbi:hypothetical protein G7067_02385 [Leucobacter insecticola]|uniref:Uncharacterized protein n=1 Tax=Leucobacter insecticola TaxID=2714934 RepID=A0A6G8FGL7_9MICO|nr:hypothetical protein [Leucobacter insecticola]QIM15518.1 hypothetical protein G7067_02385 [Leucobacter insecticola]